jgi:hypothetical protein
MPIWKPEHLDITPEAVIRGQGGDPEILRKRRPNFFDTAAQAIELGKSHLEPQMLYDEFEVESLRGEEITLSGGAVLSGAPVIEFLEKAVKVVILIGTVGRGIDEFSGQYMGEDPVLGLALDGVGSAGVEELANTCKAMIRSQLAEQGFKTTRSLNPGIPGWEVTQGQPQIFNALPAGDIGVSLTESGIMMPKKSLAFVIGIMK